MEASTMAMGGDQWCELLGWFIVENDATIRETALVFQINKTRVHNMVTKELPEVNSILAKEVRRVLSEHKKDAPRRGGEATKRKYEMKREMHAYKPLVKISLTAKMEYEPEKEIEHLNDALSNQVTPTL